MKKLAFLVGAAVGFLLGSKTGTGPYRELETKVRSITSRPEVRDAYETAKDAAARQANEAISKVSNQIADGSTFDRSSSGASV